MSDREEIRGAVSKSPPNSAPFKPVVSRGVATGQLRGPGGRFAGKALRIIEGEPTPWSDSLKGKIPSFVGIDEASPDGDLSISYYEPTPAIDEKLTSWEFPQSERILDAELIEGDLKLTRQGHEKLKAYQAAERKAKRARLVHNACIALGIAIILYFVAQFLRLVF